LDDVNVWDQAHPVAEAAQSMIRCQYGCGLKNFVHSPVFILVLAAIDQKVQMFLIDAPRLKRQHLIELSYPPKLRVNLIETEDQPFERSTLKQELLLQDIEKVLAFITTNCHNSQIIIDMLMKEVIF